MDTLHNASLEQIDRDTVIHPFTPLKAFAEGETPDPRLIETGKGVRIRDTHGRESIDAFAGLYCVNIGYGRTEVAEAIYEQSKKLAYCHSYAMQGHEPGALLAKKVLEWAPDHMRRVFFGLSGSDANETQAKFVWYYNNVLGRPEKKKIIARRRGYHGCSIMSGSMTGMPFYHVAFDIPTGPIRHTTNPHHYWEAAPGMSEEEFSAQCAADLEALILEEGPDTVGAFIAEPMLGTGGLIPAPEGYWRAIQPVLDKYDVLLIADEVVCGFGRMGTPFGSDYYEMKPDLMTCAKGLTSAYLPLSAVIVGEKVWDVFKKGNDEYGVFSHGYTYTAHPTCAAAGLANLKIIESENLMANVRNVGGYFQERLRQTFADKTFVGEVRGVNLLAAIEFVEDVKSKTRFDPTRKVGAQLSQACAKNGVITRAMPHGDILGFAPPLVATRDDVDEIIERIEGPIADVCSRLKAELN
ncbi:MAG: aminotransferase [Pseudomonadota bacterium]